jgi:hypothetical protein
MLGGERPSGEPKERSAKPSFINAPGMQDVTTIENPTALLAFSIRVGQVVERGKP